MKYIWLKTIQNAQKIYQRAVRKYTEYFSMSMTELLEEAETEEEQDIRWKKKKIQTKIIGVQTTFN